MSRQYRLDNAAQTAAERGLAVVEPGPRDIFLDLDSPQDKYVMETLLPVLKENGFEVVLDKCVHSQHFNQHAYLTAPRDLTPLERVLLQACLGSDRKRELLSFLRIEAGISPTSVLFV